MFCGRGYMPLATARWMALVHSSCKDWTCCSACGIIFYSCSDSMTMNDSRSEDLAPTSKAQPNHDISQVFLCYYATDVLVTGRSNSGTWGDVQPRLSTVEVSEQAALPPLPDNVNASQYA